MNAPISIIAARLADLRSALKRNSVTAAVILSSDPHLSEYLPERWQGRQWLSGFSGSAGTLVVAADFAGLWTDSRYWIQAEKELNGTGIELMKSRAIPNQYMEWLCKNVPAGGTVAVDGDTLGLGSARDLRSALSARHIMLCTDLDILECVWTLRPALPTAPIYEHRMPHAVMPRTGKLSMIRSEMLRHGADLHLVSTLDDVAWIFNLRGSDVEYNPVFVAHAVIARDSATLYVAKGKIDTALEDRLYQDGVRVNEYAAVKSSLAAFSATAKVLIDPERVTVGLTESLPVGVKRLEAINPSTLIKSRKTSEEIAFIRKAMEEDGAALCEFFAWLESALASDEPITELTVDEQVCAARARRPGFVSPSFGTIAGFNGNGAMPHYRAMPDRHAVIEGAGLLLIDSGGQYLGGTTDITRVVAVRGVTEDQRRDFTLVLKGMIHLTRARFPRGIRSPRLDTIARIPIWAAGIDYEHGTGHGVGYFLNVHEGPQKISPHAVPNAHQVMEPGMITSNEPGIYRQGRWGIRIENLLVTVPVSNGEFGEFLAFETLTLCPIDTRCIAPALLDDVERDWLNEYHGMVRERLQKHVQGSALNWLLQATQTIRAG